jgi:hypothetical protein
MAISIEEAFENCLKKSIEEGLPIRECAASYPEHENELVEILGLVSTLKGLDQISPRTRFVENANIRLVDKLPDRNVRYQVKHRPIKRKRRVRLKLNYGFIRIAVVLVNIL